MKKIINSLGKLISLFSLIFLSNFLLIACNDDTKLTSLKVKLVDESNFEIVDDTICFAYGQLDRELDDLLNDIVVIAEYSDSSSKIIENLNSHDEGYQLNTNLIKSSGCYAPGTNYYLEFNFGEFCYRLNIVISATTIDVPIANHDIDSGNEEEFIFVFEYQPDGYNLLELNLIEYVVDKIEVSGDIFATEVGEYEVKFACKDKNYVWNDGSSGDVEKTIKWRIVPKKVTIPMFETTEYTFKYDSNYIGIEINLIKPDNFNDNLFVLQGTTSATYVGQYQAEVVLKDNKNYIVDTNSSTKIDWKIVKASIETPQLVNDTIKYNSSISSINQSPISQLEDFIPEIMDFRSGINIDNIIGEHTAIVEINENYITNFQFNNGKTYVNLNWILEKGEYVDSQGKTLWNLPDDYIIEQNLNGQQIELGDRISSIINTNELCNVWKDINNTSTLGDYTYDSNSIISTNKNNWNNENNQIINISLNFEHYSGYYEIINIELPVKVYKKTLLIDKATWDNNTTFTYNGEVKTPEFSYNCELDNIVNVTYSYLYRKTTSDDYSNIDASEIVDAGQYKVSANFNYDKDYYRLRINNEYCDYISQEYIISKKLLDIDNPEVIKVNTIDTTYNGNFQSIVVNFYAISQNDRNTITYEITYFERGSEISKTLDNPNGLPKEVLLDEENNITAYSACISFAIDNSSNYYLSNNELEVNNAVIIKKANLTKDNFNSMPNIDVYMGQKLSDAVITNIDLIGFNNEKITDIDVSIITKDDSVILENYKEVILRFDSQNYSGDIAFNILILNMFESIQYNGDDLTFAEFYNLERVAVGIPLDLNLIDGLHSYLNNLETSKINLTYDNSNTDIIIKIGKDVNNTILTKKLHVYNKNIIETITISNNEGEESNYNIEEMYQQTFGDYIEYNFGSGIKSIEITFDKTLLDNYDFYLSIDNNEKTLIYNNVINVEDIRVIKRISLVYYINELEMSALEIKLAEITYITSVDGVYKDLVDSSNKEIKFDKQYSDIDYIFYCDNGYLSFIDIVLIDDNLTYTIYDSSDKVFDIYNQADNQVLKIKIFNSDNQCVETRVISIKYNFTFTNSIKRNGYNYLATRTNSISESLKFGDACCLIENSQIYSIDSGYGVYDLILTIEDEGYSINTHLIVNYWTELSKFFINQESNSINSYFSDVYLNLNCSYWGEEIEYTALCNNEILQGVNFVNILLNDEYSSEECELILDDLQDIDFTIIDGFTGTYKVISYKVYAESNIVYIQLLIENNLGVRQYIALVANPYTVASSFSLSNNYSVTFTLDDISYYLTKNDSGQYEFIDLDNNVLKITEDNINFALNIVTNSGYSVSSYNLTKVGQAVVLEIQLSTNEKISILVD